MRSININDSVRRLDYSNPVENQRIAGLLEAANIKSIKDLVRLRKGQLRNIEGLGDVGILRIEHALEDYGLHFCMNENMLEKLGMVNICSRADAVAVFHQKFMSNKGFTFGEGDDAHNHDDDENGERALTLGINVKHEKEPIDWNARLYDLAKEIYLNMSTDTISKENAHNALQMATNFIAEFRYYTEVKQ